MLLSSPGAIHVRSADVCVIFEDASDVVREGGIVSGCIAVCVVNVLFVDIVLFPA